MRCVIQCQECIASDHPGLLVDHVVVVRGTAHVCVVFVHRFQAVVSGPDRRIPIGILAGGGRQVHEKPNRVRRAGSRRLHGRTAEVVLSIERTIGILVCHQPVSPRLAECEPRGATFPPLVHDVPATEHARGTVAGDAKKRPVLPPPAGAHIVPGSQHSLFRRGVPRPEIDDRPAPLLDFRPVVRQPVSHQVNGGRDLLADKAHLQTHVLHGTIGQVHGKRKAGHAVIVRPVLPEYVDTGLVDVVLVDPGRAGSKSLVRLAPHAGNRIAERA